MLCTRLASYKQLLSPNFFRLDGFFLTHFYGRDVPSLGDAQHRKAIKMPIWKQSAVDDASNVYIFQCVVPVVNRKNRVSARLLIDFSAT